MTKRSSLSRSVNFKRRETLPKTLADGGISGYINMVKSIPRLDAKAEHILAKRVRDDKDLKAAEELIKSNLYLVVAAALEYKGYGLPLADIISEGNIGLMKAVKKYDPDKGFRLSTYALWWIRATINEFVLSSWSLVKLGTQAAQKKLFFGLKRLKNKLGIYHDGDMTDAEVKQIATAMEVPEADVIDMNRRLSRDVSLNTPAGEEGDEHIDVMPSTLPTAEKQLAGQEVNYQRMKVLLEELDRLGPRDKLIIQKRRLTEKPVTLDELAKELKISKERVRQLESRAMEKLTERLVARRTELE